MICPNCKKENMNEYATVCAYCNQPLYSGENAEAKAVELSAKQKKDKVKSAIITVISVILVVVVVIVALIIPKPDKDDTTTTESTTESTTLANSEENTTNNGVVDEEKSTKKNEDSSKDDPNVMDTTEEIVAYFNKNANRVKTEATKVVKNYEDREVGEIDAPPVLMWVTKVVDIEKIMADDTEPMEFATREEIVENFQVPKQSYVSCITANEVESASCKEEGNYYIITIKVKDQKNPVIGKGTGAMFDVVEAEEVEAKAEGIVDDFTTEYYDCVVVAKFEKSTNRMVHANYMTPMKLNVVIGKSEASMEMSFEKDYTITY
ncbi:MAG: hypothetical protein E7528_07050 [Ruminococcaceae bacterium]|nr:hypothetical protein [Oscillospiraceae bacterium]